MNTNEVSEMKWVQTRYNLGIICILLRSFDTVPVFTQAKNTAAAASISTSANKTENIPFIFYPDERNFLSYFTSTFTFPLKELSVTPAP